MKKYYFWVLATALAACTSNSQQEDQTNKQDSVKVEVSSNDSVSVKITENDRSQARTSEVTPPQETEFTEKTAKSEVKTKDNNSKKAAKKANTVVQEGVCPKCNKSDKVIPIQYGRPNRELQQLVKEGKAEVAGCVYEKGMPRYKCTRDNHKF